MFVEGILPAAREQLVTIAASAPLIEAAKLLRSGTDLVVVCSSEGLLAGVITKTDIVGQISQCQGASCMVAASVIMARDVVLCHPGDLLQDVSVRMKERSLKNIPVVDEHSRPIGVLTARAILAVLLHDVEYEEALLMDYVKGVGYR
jgi:CBS domain-containing protein